MVEFLADVVRATATDGKKSATAIQVHLEILNSVRRIACDPEFGPSKDLAGEEAEAAEERSGPFANECFPKLMELVDNLLFSFELAK